MNFVEAAVAILNEARRPMHVQELCDQAIERELLSKPGTNPLRSMKGRLTSESKKGDESLVVSPSKDMWELRAYADEPPVEESAAGEPAELAEEAEPESPPVAPNPEVDALLAPAQRLLRSVDPLAPTAEEAEALYADELAEADAGEPQTAFDEYTDELTADEDRQMQPEIVPERPGRMRRGERKRRERRRRDRGRDRNRERDRERKPNGADASAGVAVAATPPLGVAEVVPLIAVDRTTAATAGRSQLAVDATEVMGSAKPGQSMPVKQLVHMMRKRKLIAGDPNQAAVLLRAALVADETLHRNLGMVPPVLHRGRDQFVLSAWAKRDPAVVAAERRLDAAVATLDDATTCALTNWVRGLPPTPAERLVSLLLAVRGWQDVSWVKRVDRVCYGVGTEPVLGKPFLVGVWLGGDPVPRRGIGELRAGIAAKGLTAGLLIAAAELSEDAVSELEREGHAVSLLCADQLIEALLAAQLGVSVRALRVRVPDEALLESFGD